MAGNLNLAQRLGRTIVNHDFEPLPDVTLDLVRPDDLLCLRVSGYNLQIAPDADPQHPELKRINPQNEAYVAFIFPPQSIVEAAYFETKPGFPLPSSPPSTDPTSTQPLDPPAIPHRMAGLSRLVFHVPASVAAIPYTLSGLLDWSQLELAVAPVAAGSEGAADGLPQIALPTALQTAIELPYRLIISPGPAVPWLNSPVPITRAGRTELWHARLARVASVVGGGQALVEIDLESPGSIRAIWSPDYRPGNPPGQQDPAFPGTVTALSPKDRHEIVALSSSFVDYTVTAPIFQVVFTRPGKNIPVPSSQRFYTPLPVPVERLMLSSLGGYLRAHGVWPTDPDNPPTSVVTRNGQKEKLDISEWVHDTAGGRDQYVRIVTEGYLYPFGHRAALVKVTERRFEEIPSGDEASSPGAYLRQHMYVVVRQPEKQYDGGSYQNGGREMPFAQSVRVTTLVTPDIDYPYSPPPAGIQTNAPIQGTTGSFWIMVGGTPFPFHVVALDIEENRTDFTTGLIFVPGSETQQGLVLVQKDYQTHDDRRACNVPGQKVAYAPSSQRGADDATLTTSALYFDTQSQSTAPGGFVPILFKANVHIPAVEQILGTDASSTIKLFDGYLANNLDSKAGVFAQIVSGSGPDLSPDSLAANISADKAGGFATPNLGISSISRAYGPLAGDPLKAAQNNFDPTDFFPAASGAKLFGVFDLMSLIPSGTTSEQAPKLTIQPQPPGLPTQIVTTIDWTPILNLQPVTVGSLTLTPLDPDPRLYVHGTITRPVGKPGDGAFNFTGEIANLHLDFANVIAITFDRFHFVAQSGRKLDLAVDIASSGGIQFEGDLEFVNQLQDIIPPGVFGDGPSLDVTPTEARLGYAIGLPPLAVGVFSLQQVSLSAGLELPFLDGKPTFDFSFAERHHPFLLTVTLFGGGGFFHLQVGADGIKQVEAALEFGGNFSLDIVVASGSVHVMAGIYFSMQTGAGTTAVTLSGYLRMGGELSVLGLISVSVEFYLSFTYDSAASKATGEATLTVAVHVAFVSKSVDLTVRRSFGSHGGDPTFAQVMDRAAWQEYAAAFA